MTSTRLIPYSHRRTRRRSESGVVMVLTLICLAMMLISAVALTRSSTNSLLQAGNFAFKRDLLNQAERGLAQAIYELDHGNELVSDLNRETNHPGVNYSATQLESNAQGIPNVLINESAFTSSGMTQQDFTDNSAGITIRTVIDRQCSASGAFSTATCVPFLDVFNAANAGSMSIKRPKGESRVTYRISVRVKGLHNTEAFQQMIVAP